MIDARTMPENATVETDVCVVGAGITGISLVRELIGESFQVCLLESGGLEPDKATQSLSWGNNIGLPYFPLDTSLARSFGGTSHFWKIPIGDNRFGARFRSLDPIDFEERSWVPHSGWPFDKAHLDPFYERAQAVCQLGPYTYELEEWEDPVEAPRLPFVGDRVKTAIFQFGCRDIFFKDYQQEILRARNVTVYLRANVVDVETTETARTVTRLRVATLGGNRFWVKARLFILALGGIETPRLLLNSTKVQRFGLGNQTDLVGRFFMEHPHIETGIYLPADPKLFETTRLYKEVYMSDGVPIMGKLAISENVQRRESLLNYVAGLYFKFGSNPDYQRIDSPGTDSLKEIFSGVFNGKPANLRKNLKNVCSDMRGIAVNINKKLKRRFSRKKKIPLFRLRTMAEQAPNPRSRVLLSPERDILGQNRVQLNWQLSPQDMTSIVRAQEIIGEELRRAGLGRLIIELEGTTPPVRLHGGWHHMGTTRMHIDSRKGVVDENCRVHGTSNLFIAGSSTFPTSGYANPALTIVALSVRLADHVKRSLN